MKKVLLSILLFFALSGCAKMEYDLTIKEDGSATVKYTLAMDNSLKEMVTEGEDPLKDEKEELQLEGFWVTDYTDEEMFGITATKDFESIENMDVLEKLFTGETEVEASQLFTIEEGFIFRKCKFNADFNLTDVIPSDLTEEDAELNSLILENIDMSFTINVPTKIKNSNGAISEDGKTAVWTLVPGSLNNMNMEFNLYNVKTLVVLASIGVALIIGLIMVIIRLKFNKQDNDIE